MNITIAIPTMRRWTFLKDSIPIYLARKEVVEVIICDETGEDAKIILKEFNNPKLRVIVNEKRLGIYQNKMKALGLAKTYWVALLDSDNIFTDDWFDTLSDINLDPMTIYASADFKNINIETGTLTTPCTEFSGLVLNKSNWNTVLKNKKWNFLLNDGNWLLPQKTVECLPKGLELFAADAIFMLRQFVLKGFIINYVSGLEYIHTVHSGSSWLLTEKDSTKLLNTMDWSI